ncbi:F0F1 ATP synthase subunit delta [Noviherbaspirillum agri]
MEFNWTTFALEILNFLVLVWILTHFLYRPVRKALDRRKAVIEASIGKAESQQAAAEGLKRQYENRMADWEAERARARAQLADEIAAERVRLMAELHQAIELEREKNHALERRRAIELRQRATREAAAEAASFAARLLSRLASPALERRITEIAIEDLPELPEDRIRALRQACVADEAHITSAYPLSADVRANIAAALSNLAGATVACSFEQDRDLIAGLRMSTGSWVVRCNLADELGFFAETSDARTT